jgi:hypothetical protein
VNQQAIIVAMVGSTTKKQQADPTAILNALCHEGWELVNGDFVFVTHGQQSRDKFLSSGQNVAVAGTVMCQGAQRGRRPADMADLLSAALIGVSASATLSGTRGPGRGPCRGRSCSGW